jgi:hypothetical protein
MAILSICASWIADSTRVSHRTWLRMWNFNQPLCGSATQIYLPQFENLGLRSWRVSVRQLTPVSGDSRGITIQLMMGCYMKWLNLTLSLQVLPLSVVTWLLQGSHCRQLHHQWIQPLLQRLMAGISGHLCGEIVRYSVHQWMQNWTQGEEV